MPQLKVSGLATDWSYTPGTNVKLKTFSTTLGFTGPAKMSNINNGHPRMVSGCVLCLRPETITTDGTNVTGWTDESSVAATITTQSIKPLYTVSALNGKPGVTFAFVNNNGTSGPDPLTYIKATPSGAGYGTGGPGDLDAAMSLLLVLNPSGADFYEAYMGFGDKQTLQSVGVMRDGTTTNLQLLNQAKATGNWNIKVNGLLTDGFKAVVFTGNNDGSAQALYSNGVAQSTIGIVNWNTGSRADIYLGCWKNHWISSSCVMCEAVVYNRKLNSTDLNRLNTYCKKKYGLGV